MKLKRASIAGVAIVLGAACLFGPRVLAWAQTLADTAAAGAAGATLGAAGGSGLLPPSQYAKKATDAAKKMQSMGKGAHKGEPNIPNPSAQAAQSQSAVTLMQWGNENGQQMLHQLVSHPHYKYPRGHVGKGRRHHRNVLAKYRKPARGWLAYYLLADRYKVTSHDWRFTTTPNDKFYYDPWVLATKHRPAGDVIGFHTWQDAVAAGYRPDPSSLPAPGRQLALLASYSQGPMMEKYIEYTYSGQIPPTTFDANYRYVTIVAHQVKASKKWSYLLAPTVEQAIGATLGLNLPPAYIGKAAAPLKQSSVPGTPGAASANASPVSPDAAGAPGAPSSLPAPPAPPAP